MQVFKVVKSPDFISFEKVYDFIELRVANKYHRWHIPYCQQHYQCRNGIREATLTKTLKVSTKPNPSKVIIQRCSFLN